MDKKKGTVLVKMLSFIKTGLPAICQNVTKIPEAISMAGQS